MKYPHDHENDVIYFGKTNFRNQMRKFGIKTDDRRRHTYVIGKTGMGKTTLLENMVLSDIYAGHGCCYVDPHGDTAEGLLNYIPSWRTKDVVYFNPSDLEFPVGFNILEAVSDDMKHLVAAGMMGVFKKIWEGVWSARMEYILNNTILALLDNPGTTLLDINRVLSDKEYRKGIIANVQDPIVRQFWVKEFANYQDKFASEAVAPIQNKVGQFLSASIVRNIVAQKNSTIKIRDIMDEEKIFIVNLSKGRIGEDASRLLGGMLITKIQMSAMERVDIKPEDRTDFYLYVDEFQNFAVESFASILSEARKYKLNLIMAHQYIAQLTEEVRDAVFGNVGTMIVFRVGSPDAQFMEDEFMPRFTPEDIINLPKFQIYLKLMIDGVSSQPFSAMTLAPIAHKTNSEQEVIESSRTLYGGSRKEIEQKVEEWSGFGGKMDMEKAFGNALKDAKQKRKQQYVSQDKPKHKYNCTRCNKEFGLPVELDRSRPIYCEDCHPIIKEERNNRGSKKKTVDASAREVKKKERRVLEKVPKITDGEVVKKESVKEAVSLSALTPKEPKREKKKPEQKEQNPEIIAKSGEPRAGDFLQKKSKKPVQNISHNNRTKNSHSRNEVQESRKESTSTRKQDVASDERRHNKKPDHSAQQIDTSHKDSKRTQQHTVPEGESNETKEKKVNNDIQRNSDRRDEEKRSEGKPESEKQVETNQTTKDSNESVQDDPRQNGEEPKRQRKRRRRKKKKTQNPSDAGISQESQQSQRKEPQVVTKIHSKPVIKPEEVQQTNSSKKSTSVSPGEIVNFD